MADKKQNYQNHRRMVIGFHYFTYSLIIAMLAGSIVFTIQNSAGKLFEGCLLILATSIMIMLAFFTRQFALRAQNRAIRAEENFRHFVLSGKIFDSRLRIGQIVALRFAADEEFVALSARAANENMKADDIKKAIKNWRGDFHRV